MNIFDYFEVRKILVRSVNWIGDAVMTTPAIGVIRERFPQAEITLLANQPVSDLFSPHQWIDRVITFDRNGAHKGIAGRFRLAAELRKHSFDLAIILPNSFESALIPWLAGIPVRLGKRSDGRSLMLTGRYLPDHRRPACHEVEYYLDLVRHFGITGQPRVPRLTVTPAEEHNAMVRLAEHGVTADDFLIAVNPGAAFGSAKRWYPERFAEVARQLTAEWGARIVIFGGSAETAIASAIESHLEGTAINLAGKTSVRELMSLIKRSDFFITNDSGPMHIAAAFNVPLVAIFGSTDHTGTSPCSGNAVVVRNDVECAPCKLRECPTDHICMTTVTAEDVAKESIRLMASIRAAAKSPADPR